MGEDTVSRWNVDSMREHFQAKLDAAVKYVDTRLAYMENAVSLASKNMEDKLASINTTAYVTRIEFKERLERIDLDIGTLQRNESKLAGKAEQKSVTMAFVLSAVGLLLGIVSIVMSLSK